MERTNRIDYLTNEKQLEAAFIELLNEMPIEKISIQKLSQKSKLSRGTFYLHYENIYQLLENYEDNLIAELRLLNKDFYKFSITEFNFVEGGNPCFKETYEWILQNKLAITVLLSHNGSPSFEKKWRKCIFDLFQTKINYDQIKLVDYDLFCVVISGTWINIIKHWLSVRQDVSSEALSQLISRVTKNILISFYQENWREI